MKILPAIDLFGGKAVRLFKGDYDKMTIYSNYPVQVALDFKAQGAEWIHVVDLEGAKSGETPNIETIKKIVNETGLKVEVGGGIRSIDVVSRYIEAGVSRLILGTAAVKDEAFLKQAVQIYGEKIAVGVDLKDGMVAIHGWTEKSDEEGFAFCKKMQAIGVKTIIATDISKDGAMKGTNHELYKKLSEQLEINVIASGGVSSIKDVEKLSAIGVYGTIIGKAYYTGVIDLKKAIQVANDN